MLLLLLLMSFALSLKAEAGEIIGGHEAKPHSRPYMAFLQIFDENSEESNCGGFLIQNNVVLTAAHCNGRKIKVKLGAHNIKKKEKKSKVCTVCATFPHDAYNETTNSNDIMLLKGDSGGPLVCNKVAQGIVSYGKDDGKAPGVYTKISRFISWINETRRKM